MAAMPQNITAPTHAAKTWAVNKYVELYTEWHSAEPDKGYDAKAAEWKAKLE